MDKSFARRMNDLTTEFYRCTSESFSATRQSAWPGWCRLLSEAGITASSRLRLLDVACGNLRFEEFLCGHVLELETWAFDNCEDLVALGDADVHFSRCDVSGELIEGDTSWASHVPPCDLAVSFGFMHHLPLFSQRAELLSMLIRHVKPGGHAAVAFWQFADDRRLRAKARPIEGGEGNDYLLGWQDRQDVARYCHFCDEDEIDRLVESVSSIADEVVRYSADGRTGALNRYVVLANRETSQSEDTKR